MPSPTRAVLTLLPLLIVAIASCSSPRSSTNATEPGANTENPMLASMKVEYRQKVTDLSKKHASDVYEIMDKEIREAKANTTQEGRRQIDSLLRRLKGNATAERLAANVAGISWDSVAEMDEVFREMGINPDSVMSHEQRTEIRKAEMDRLKSELVQAMADIVARNR